MGGTGFVARRLARRRRSSLVLVGLLAALTTAVVVGAAAGARRVDTAYDRLDRAIGIADAEVLLSGDDDPVEVLSAEDDLVGGLQPFTSHLFAPEGATPGLDFFVVSLGPGAGVDDLVVLEGTEPAADDPDTVAVNEEAAEEFDLAVGDELVLEGLGPAAFEALVAGGSLDLDQPGVPAPVRVGAVVRHRRDIAQREQAGPGAYATAAFGERWADEVAAYGPIVTVQLRPGVTAADLAQRLGERYDDPETYQVQDLAREEDQLQDAMRLQAAALALVAVGGALAGGWALALAALRHAASTREDDGVLRAVGADPRLRRAVVVRGFAVPGAVGVAVGVVVAVAASGMFPLGALRRAEPDPGLQVDGLVVAGGSALAVALVAGAIALAVRRAGRPVVAGRVSSTERVATALPPTVGFGVRLALAPVADRARPALQGLLGSAVAVTGAVAALTFGASLDGLRSTPSRYGQAWDLELTSGEDGEAIDESIEAFRDDDRIASMARARVVGSALVGPSTIQAWAVAPVVGPAVAWTVLEGREPASPDEVLVGPATAAQAGTQVGGTIEASGPDGPLALRVVGIGIFPVVETEAFTEGALLTPDGFDRIATSDGYEAVLVTWRRGVDADAAFADLQADGYGFSPRLPPAVANLDEVDGFPAAVGGLVALLGTAIVVHSVVVATRQRRRDLAVLLALGVPRRRLATSVVVQGLVLVLGGALVGVPVGVVIGRVTWRELASSVDVAVVTEVPGARIALSVAVATAAGVAVVAAPAVAAARMRAAAILRRAG